MKQKTRNFLRILIGIGAPLAVIAGIATLWFRGSPFFCPFHFLTHLYCPGCGSGRAATALVHFDFARAFRCNALFCIFALPCGYYCLKRYVAFVFGRDILPMKELPNWANITIAVVFCVFWVLRNIPIFPFTLLAPIP